MTESDREVKRMSVVDKSEALRLLSGLENGGMTADDACFIAEELDPVLVYVIVKFLRESYPASDPAATSVLARVVKLTSTCRGLVERSKAGERDPVARWFAQDYSYGEFRGRGPELIELIVDKLDS